MLTYFAGFFAHYGFNIVSDFLTLERAIPIITMYLLIGIYLLFIWKST